VRWKWLVATACASSLVAAAAPLPARADEAAHPAAHDPRTRAAVEARPAPEHPASPVPIAAPSRRAKWGSLGAVGGLYLSATTYMYFAWYHDQPDLPAFRVGGDGFFGEDTYAGGADKLGHAWSSLMLSRVTGAILIRGGWKPSRAALIASGMALGLLTLFEVKDGFYTEFSQADAVFNTLGAGLGFAMLAYPPLDELIDFRVEYFPSREYLELLHGKRPPSNPAAPRQVTLNFVEDYSGQRYLLALHLGALPRLRGLAWARLVDVALGYETDGYRPEPLDPEARTSQHLFLGLAVNMQGLLELALADRRGAFARRSRAAGHLVFELLEPPFGSAAIVGGTRSHRGDASGAQ
jgi:hypothetical protein